MLRDKGGAHLNENRHLNGLYKIFVEMNSKLNETKRRMFVHLFSFEVFGRPFVKRFALCYRTVFCPVCPVCL